MKEQGLTIVYTTHYMEEAQELSDRVGIIDYGELIDLGTPEELIIDFGVNPNPFGGTSEPIPVTQRIICNMYTAKRMLHVLQLTIQRHEAAFGVVETDVQRRAANRQA